MDVRKGECSGGGDHRRLSYLRLAARTSGLPQGGRVALPGQTSCADRARPAVHATSRECDFVKIGNAWEVFTVNADATNPRQITTPSTGSPPLGVTLNKIHPVWVALRSQLAFIGNGDIY